MDTAAASTSARAGRAAAPHRQIRHSDLSQPATKPDVGASRLGRLRESAPTWVFSRMALQQKHDAVGEQGRPPREGGGCARRAPCARPDAAAAPTARASASSAAWAVTCVRTRACCVRCARAACTPRTNWTRLVLLPVPGGRHRVPLRALRALGAAAARPLAVPLRGRRHPRRALCRAHAAPNAPSRPHAGRGRGEGRGVSD